ncbi:hypothetical protein [Anaerofustis butyriciformans]|uniref:hypothetical protein n=1 Tax=Anaerofustis butyriciformans TaxID=3108533 RepID=UPI002E30250E|nr:hypothetical protein [Anaerofustis sp. HA2171]
MKIMSFNVNNWGGFIPKPETRDYSIKGYIEWDDWNNAVDDWRRDNYQTIKKMS